jgi:hypothetical protein
VAQDVVDVLVRALHRGADGAEDLELVGEPLGRRHRADVGDDGSRGPAHRDVVVADPPLRAADQHHDVVVDGHQRGAGGVVGAEHRQRHVAGPAHDLAGERPLERGFGGPRQLEVARPAGAPAGAAELQEATGLDLAEDQHVGGADAGGEHLERDLGLGAGPARARARPARRTLHGDSGWPGGVSATLDRSRVVAHGHIGWSWAYGPAARRVPPSQVGRGARVGAG